MVTKKRKREKNGRITKRELERGATDRERENKNKGAGERRGAEWRWLGGGAHSNEQVVGGREG